MTTTFSLKQGETRTSSGPIPHPLNSSNHLIIEQHNSNYWTWSKGIEKKKRKNSFTSNSNKLFYIVQTVILQSNLALISALTINLNNMAFPFHS